jgi:hypothetical protein
LIPDGRKHLLFGLPCICFRTFGCIAVILYTDNLALEIVTALVMGSERAPVFRKYEPVAPCALVLREHAVHIRQICARKRFDTPGHTAISSGDGGCRLPASSAFRPLMPSCPSVSIGCCAARRDLINAFCLSPRPSALNAMELGLEAQRWARQQRRKSRVKAK